METFSALLPICEGNPAVTGGDAKLWCFLWSAHEQTVEQTIETNIMLEPDTQEAELNHEYRFDKALT